MIFANSALLWGLALGSVPIIIYLLNRRRFKRITWAAMEFLLQAMKKNRRRLRIENLLLLIIRTLIVLLFVLAIARPLVKASGIFDVLGMKQKNLVIVVDNSYSMGYKTGPTTSFERAVKYARSFVESLESGDRVAVLLMNSSPEPLYETPVTIGGEKDKKDILADLNEVRLSYETTNVPKTLDKVLDILDKFEPGAGEEAQENKTVYLLTDCQFNGWAEQGRTDTKHLREIAKSLAKRKAELKVLDVGEQEAPNFAITELSCDRALVGTEIPVRFSATLTNFSKRSYPDIVIHFSVDDLPQKSETVNLEPGNPRKVDFTYLFKNHGFHHVHVSADADPLEADNNAYVAINVRKEVDVLVVDGRPMPGAWESEIDYLVAFFEAGYSEEDRQRISPFEPDYWTHMRFENEMQGPQPLLELRKYDVVILANVSDLTRETAGVVTKYVEEGGSLLMFLGDMVIPERYNEILFKEGKGLLPVRLIDVAGDRERQTGLRLNMVTFDHPITRFFKIWPLPLEKPMTFQYYDNELPKDAEDTVVIVTYADGKKTPAILEKRFGRGRFILVTNSAWDEWNNWNKYQFFPILLSEMLSYLGESSKTSNNYLVGQTYQKLLTTSEWASEVYIVPPTGESIKKNLEEVKSEAGVQDEDEESGERFLLTHEETGVAGTYKVVFTGKHGQGASERTENFAVNVDTNKESDMTKVVEGELQKAMPALKAKQIVTHHSEVKGKAGDRPDETGGREFWKYFIAAVLILLALETLLAQRFGKHEK
jgi:uncharacterized membrane protein